MGTLISSGGAPPTWQMLQSSGSCTPSWQRAQMGILFWDTRATSSCVPGWLMLAWQVTHWYPASRRPVWLTRMLLKTWSRSSCDLGWHCTQLLVPTMVVSGRS